jgi:hypothetical protein
MVIAYDLAGQRWWLPAAAVWADADASSRPDHPCPVGLATASDRATAIIAGLSDRLGWEAVFEFGRKVLPAAPVVEAPERLVVLDGRVGHDVPTVVALGDDILRWGPESPGSRPWRGHCSDTTQPLRARASSRSSPKASEPPVSRWPPSTSQRPCSHTPASSAAPSN